MHSWPLSKTSYAYSEAVFPLRAARDPQGGGALFTKGSYVRKECPSCTGEVVSMETCTAHHTVYLTYKQYFFVNYPSMHLEGKTIGISVLFY